MQIQFEFILLILVLFRFQQNLVLDKACFLDNTKCQKKVDKLFQQWKRTRNNKTKG